MICARKNMSHGEIRFSKGNAFHREIYFSANIDLQSICKGGVDISPRLYYNVSQ